MFLFSKKLWYHLFDFRIGQTGGDIFRYDPVKGQKMVKLPQGPDSGFCDMNGRGVEIGCKNDKMPVTNRFVKSAYLRSSLNGWVFPGVINPIFFLCCSLTKRRDSTKSLSLDTITAP